MNLRGADRAKARLQEPRPARRERRQPDSSFGEELAATLAAAPPKADRRTPDTHGLSHERWSVSADAVDAAPGVQNDATPRAVIASVAREVSTEESAGALGRVAADGGPAGASADVAGQATALDDGTGAETTAPETAAAASAELEGAAQKGAALKGDGLEGAALKGAALKGAGPDGAQPFAGRADALRAEVTGADGSTPEAASAGSTPTVSAMAASKDSAQVVDAKGSVAAAPSIDADDAAAPGAPGESSEVAGAGSAGGSPDAGGEARDQGAEARADQVEADSKSAAIEVETVEIEPATAKEASPSVNAEVIAPTESQPAANQSPVQRAAKVTEPVEVPQPQMEDPDDPTAKWSLLRLASGERAARVRLEHPTLGSLRLDIALGEGELDVRVLAPSLMSAIRLERDAGRIRQLLQEQNVQLANLRVDVDRPGRTRESSERASAQRPPHAGRGRGRISLTA